jgi:hypothetical protein
MNLRRRQAAPIPLANVIEHRDNGVTATLHEAGRRTTPHHPHYLCGNTHCYSHMVDEPDPGPRGTTCGECFHAWPHGAPYAAKPAATGSPFTGVTSPRPAPPTNPPSNPSSGRCNDPDAAPLTT